MNKTFLSLCLAAAVCTGHAQDNPRIQTLDLSAKELAHYMAPGWNLGNTLEAGNSANIFTNNGGTATETLWQSTKTTQDIINLVKANGFKSVRIPTAWVMGHLTDRATMTIDPLWLARVKEVVDYCINANLYVVLNDHWDGGWIEYDGFTTGVDVSAKKEQLRLLWTNIATAFSEYDERLIFAGMNEPGVGGASPEASGGLMFDQYTDNDKLIDFVTRLQEYEQVFIDAVRATGGNNARRVLVVQGPNTNIGQTNKYYDVTKLTDSATDRLMVEIHHYDPYQFCGMTEDASWGKVWYYWYGHSPARASSDRIAPDAQRTAIQTNMNSLKSNFVDKGFPVIVGEYGCNHKTLATTVGTQANHDESVKFWYQFSTEYAYEAGLIPFAWDTNNLGRPNMTIFNRNGLSVNDQTIYDGVFAGDQAGRAAFNAIYPEPSTTNGVTVRAVDDQTAEKVYDLGCRVVATGVKDFSRLKLKKGIYIFKGKKYVVN
ncbi:MAG: glycoside hydrolase family 5 protein [Prevotella sp.]|nr:glycoside hydrolase family 5 protein [Prevotella sp.]